MLRTLGRRGVRDLVARACDAAQLTAERLAADGLTVLNEVVANRVHVRLVDGPITGSPGCRGPVRRAGREGGDGRFV